MTLTCDLDLELAWFDLWVLHIDSLRRTFDQSLTRAVVGQRSLPAGYILYCNIFIIKKLKMYNNNKTQTHNEFLLLRVRWKL